MLELVDNKTVRGATFVVRVIGIHHVRYEHAGMTASVEIEGGLGPAADVNWLVYVDTLRGWDPPHGEVDMSNAQRDEILANINASLKLLGMPNQLA